MGRSILGNSVTTASVLSTTLGVTSASTYDNNTTATANGYFAAIGPVNSEAIVFEQNHMNQQENGNSFFGVQQDPLSDYTILNAKLYDSNNFTQATVVFDADLNIVKEIPFQAIYSSTIAVRIYDSKVYHFQVISSTLRANVTDILSNTVQTYSYTPPAGYNPGTSGQRVFNWPVNGKFFLAIRSDSAASSGGTQGCFTFDINTNTWAQFGAGISGRTVYQMGAMHVNEAGTGVSVEMRDSDSTNWGVATYLSSGTGTFTAFHPNGTVLSGSQYQTLYFSNGGNDGRRGPVLPGFVMGYNSFNTSGSNGTIAHLVGGDTAVRTTVINASTAVGSTSQAIFQITRASFTTPVNQVNIGNVSNNKQGVYPVSLVGNTLTFGQRLSTVDMNYGSTIQSKLKGYHRIYVAYTSNYFYQVGILNENGNVTYSFNQAISQKNQFNFNPSETLRPTSFVTSKGKLFSLASFNQSSNQQSTFIKAQLPVFISDTSKTYNIAVIGAGGFTSSNTAGESSIFAGVAAAAGNTRDGNISGTTVFTSGPSTGTGGRGYTDDLWGQGEDSQGAGQYGGGSGYVNIKSLTLNGNTFYPYKAGIGPRYGKQGAILISEV